VAAWADRVGCSLLTQQERYTLLTLFWERHGHEYLRWAGRWQTWPILSLGGSTRTALCSLLNPAFWRSIKPRTQI
jgi:hypothetical protein